MATRKNKIKCECDFQQHNIRVKGRSQKPYFISSAATFRNTGNVYLGRDRYHGSEGRGLGERVMQDWKCGSGKKPRSWVVNVSTGRWQVRGVSDERQCQGGSQRNRAKEVWGYCQWLCRVLASPLKCPEPLSITTWSKRRKERATWENNQCKSSCRHWCPAFISIMRLVSLTKSHRNANTTPLLHVSLKNQQRQIRQIFVWAVHLCRILYLFGALRAQ